MPTGPRKKWRMRFSKWHALGNAYLVVERNELSEPLSPELVSRLCDPHYGAGADGVLEIAAVHGPEADALVWNPDGSLAELSGNGARIAAMWLARRSAVAFPLVRMGERTVAARIDGDGVEVDLGPVDVSRPEALEVGGERLEFTPVSIGNPHAVFRREPTRAELLRLGPLVEGHERFPARTNVQLVRADGPGDLTVRVWERGAGETLASGSSAAAAAAAAVTHGWCESPVRVHLPGGTLLVDIREGRATLSGPVTEIFRGETVSDP
jgi:diaminopimelate epimerase